MSDVIASIVSGRITLRKYECESSGQGLRGDSYPVVMLQKGNTQFQETDCLGILSEIAININFDIKIVISQETTVTNHTYDTVYDSMYHVLQLYYD